MHVLSRLVSSLTGFKIITNIYQYHVPTGQNSVTVVFFNG
jgi:hypothetical protein